MSFNSDDQILSRNDGHTFRSIPGIDTNETDESVDRIPVMNAEEKQVKKPEGLMTHIKCRWCGAQIRDAYIPQLKNGRNGQPYEIILNYEPCNECRTKWNEMVVFIETSVTAPYKDCLPIAFENRILDEYIDETLNPEEYKNCVAEEYEEDGRKIQLTRMPIYPTGRYTGVELEAVRRYLGGNTDEIKNGTVIYFDTTMFAQAFGEYYS